MIVSYEKTCKISSLFVKGDVYGSMGLVGLEAHLWKDVWTPLEE